MAVRVGEQLNNVVLVQISVGVCVALSIMYEVSIIVQKGGAQGE